MVWQSWLPGEDLGSCNTTDNRCTVADLALWRGVCISDLCPKRPSWDIYPVKPSYLAAFAEAHSYSLVTFDAGFERWPALKLTLLSSVQNLPGK
jgi:hypothetical protein